MRHLCCDTIYFIIHISNIVVFFFLYRELFRNGGSSSILIEDSDSKSFKLFIQYFYGMNPQITASNIGAISYLAQKYLVTGLQEICNTYLDKSISIDNVVTILESLHACHQKVYLYFFLSTCDFAIYHNYINT